MCEIDRSCTEVTFIHAYFDNLIYIHYFQLISANFDMNSVQYNQAPKPFTARYVRFEPMFWYNEICLRVEIYGCDGE